MTMTSRHIYWIFLQSLLVFEICSAAAPYFNNLPGISIPLREDIAVQTSFFQVDATDPDGDRMQYSIVGPPGAPFIINPISGIVSVRRNPGLDFETVQQYQLQVSVNDSTGQITQSTIQVKIEDVNEPPVYLTLPASYKLPEDLTKSAVLWNVTAIDPESQPVTYTLVGPLGVPFDVSPEGIITLKANPNLNFETRREFKLTVAATDGELSTLSTFTVHITDVNEPPQILNMGSKITVPKATVGSIFKIDAIDEDNNDKLWYSFTVSPNATDIFTINPDTGELIVNCPPCLNPASENLYEIHITAHDTAGHNTTGLMYVEAVHRMDIPWIWNIPTSRAIFENRTDPINLFSPRTIDLTGGGKLSYHMKVNPSEGQFTIDPDTGVIRVKKNPNFDYEKNYKYDITVIASNGVNTSTPHQIHVRIANTNEKPYITNIKTLFTVREDVNTGILIDKIRAKDPDGKTTLTYSLEVEPPSGQDKFLIDSLTGELSVAVNPDLDYETMNQYTLIVTASDGQLKSDPFKITVGIKDVNEPPFYLIPHLQIRIPEEMPVGDVLPVSCKAVDNDSWDATLLYQMIRSKHSDFLTLDTTNGCKLKIAKTLDSETPASPDQISLVIRAIDSQGLVDTLYMDIDVDNINDNSPEFSPTNYEVDLMELLPIGSSVIDVTTRDIDVGAFGKISYRISTSPGDHYFRISPSGHVTIRAKIDRDTIQKLIFKVIASDRGSPSRSGTGTVTVFVQDDNDHRPIFEKAFYDFEARNDTEVGTSIGTIRATDGDSNGNLGLTYTLLGISDKFELLSKTGELRVIGKLDPKTRYLLQATAKDDGIPPEISKAVQIRVDTYICRESLVRMEINQAYSFFDEVGRARFVRALRDEIFNGFVPKIEGVRVGQKPGTSVVLVYFLRSNRTESVTMIAEDKKFVSVTEILYSSNTGLDWRPNLRFVTGSFLSFPVTEIGRECEIEKVNWWLDTEPGRVTLGVLATVGGVLLLGALGALGKIAADRLSLFKGWRRISPRSKGTLRNTKLPGFDDKQNWWKLKPKAAFGNNSALEEKFKPPLDRPLSSKGVRLKVPSPGKSGRPLPAGETGLEF